MENHVFLDNYSVKNLWNLKIFGNFQKYIINIIATCLVFFSVLSDIAVVVLKSHHKVEAKQLNNPKNL